MARVAMAAPRRLRKQAVTAALAVLLLATAAPTAWNAWHRPSHSENDSSQRPSAAAAERLRGAAPGAAAVSPGRAAAAGTLPTREPAASAELLQVPALARELDDLIGDALGGGAWRDDPTGFRSRLEERVRRRFAAPLGTDALALVLRYVGYLETLDAMHLRPPSGDVAALRAIYEARRSLRMAMFSTDEYAALFAADDRLDRFTLARFEIEADSQRSPADRAAAIAAAEGELAATDREARSHWREHWAVQAQTAAFDAQGVSDQARYSARSAERGDTAAQRLAELDRSERDWGNRLTQYEQTLAAHRRGTVSSDELDATRNRLFNEREQLRLDAALSLRRKSAG